MIFLKRKKGWDTAVIIAVIYFILGIIWLIYSGNTKPENQSGIINNFFFHNLSGILYFLGISGLLSLLIYKQITNRDQQINKLKKNNYLLNQFTGKSTGLNIFIIDKNGTIIFSRGDNIIWPGKKSSELEGSNIFKNPFKSNDIGSFTGFYRNLWNVKQNLKQEINISGQLYEIQGSIILSDFENELSYDVALLIFKDITQVKRNDDLVKSEKAIHDQKIREFNMLLTQAQALNENQHLIIDNLFNGIILFSIDPFGAPGRIKEINKAACNILGLSTEDCDEDSLKKVLKFDSSFDSSKVFENDYRQIKQVIVRCKTASALKPEIKSIELIGKHLSSPTGSFILFIVRDIKTEVQVRLNNLTLNLFSLLGGLSQGVMLIKKDGACYFVNNFMKEILKDNKAEWENINLSDLATQGTDIDISGYFKRCLDGEIIEIPEYKLTIHKNRRFSSILYPISNDAGDVEIILRLVNDITSVNNEENKLQILKEYSNESNLLRTVFLSNLSHEIRTPMNGILGFIDILENEGLNESQNTYLKYIRQSFDALLDMLNLLFEISQIENKKVVIQSEWFELTDLSKEIEKYAEEQLIKKGKTKTTFTLVPPKRNESGNIFNDKGKLLSIWKILINNAVKFTPQGNIEAGIKMVDDEQLEFWVSDTGVGIKAFNINAIFLPFATFNHSKHLIFGGLGLGLPIARAYTELLGGKIDVKSEESTGSRFIVKIPLKKGVVLLQKKKSAYPIRRKLLVVQHGFESAGDIISYLGNFGVEVIHVQTGTYAIELLLDQKDIDLVISDTRLSDMNGMELLKAVKRMRPNLPVLAQTSFLIAEEKNQYINSGFDDYLVKPINKSILHSWIKNGN